MTPPLWEPPPVAAGPHGDHHPLVAIYAALANCPALRGAASRAAARAAHVAAVGNRGASGETLEACLVDELSGPVRAQLTDQVVAAVGGELVEVVLADGGGGRGTDLVLRLAWASGFDLHLRLNVKWQDSDASPATWFDACSQQTLLRAALGHEAGDNPALDVHEVVADLAAGRRTLHPWGDYVVLLVRGSKAAGTLDELACFGLLTSSAPGGGLPLRLNTARQQTVMFCAATPGAPEDRSAALVDAMLPPVTDAQVRATLLAHVVGSGQVVGPEQVAAWLDALDLARVG